jgi:hypothetical protein
VNDLVSNRWTGVVALAGWATVVSLLFVLHGFAAVGLGWMILAFSVALWPGRRSTRSITQVIHDIEAEPLRAVVMPARLVVPKAVP